MDDELLIVGGLILIVLVIIFYTQKDKITGDSNLIQDNAVNTSKVLKSLNEFTPSIVPNRKFGFTEKDIEKQLENHFKKIYQHVTTQHGVEGTNAKAIDFDIGRGKVGIELKLAQEVIKEGGNDRLLGQVIKYKTRKYNASNLIVAIVGFEDEMRQTALSDLEDFLIEQKVELSFLNAGNRNQVKV